MPIRVENKVFEREFKRGLEQGLEQGREEGREQGREEGREQGLEQGLQQGLEKGELKILRRLIEKRFGPLPEWAEKRLTARSASELEELSVRVLDAETLQELLN